MSTVCIIFTCSTQLAAFVELFAFINEASFKANQVKGLCYVSQKFMGAYYKVEVWYEIQSYRCGRNKSATLLSK